jgi:hypothetical protein
MIHGILHDQFHLGFGDPGITRLARARGTGPSAMQFSIGPLRNARATIAFASLASCLRSKSVFMMEEFNSEEIP